MIHHYITKYQDDDDGKIYAVAWIQINVFQWCFCLSQRKIELPAMTAHKSIVIETSDSNSVIAEITDEGVKVTNGFRFRTVDRY